MNKKASLNLSIEAIVILVMAMAILGLGLGFIRTLIGQGQNQFEGAIANAKLKNPASSDIPITINPNIVLKKGKLTPIEVGVYNKGLGAGDIALSIIDDTECPISATTQPDATKRLSMSAIPQIIAEGTASGYLASFYAETGIEAGKTFICTIKATGTSSLQKQFYIKVVS